MKASSVSLLLGVSVLLSALTVSAAPLGPPSVLASHHLLLYCYRVRATVGALVIVVLLLVLLGVLFLCRNQTDAVRSAQRNHAAGLPILTAVVLAMLLYGVRVSAACSVSVDRLLCHLVVISPYCVTTGLIVSIYCSRKTQIQPVVSMEMTQRVDGGHGLDEDEEYDDIDADVTCAHSYEL